MKMRRRLVESSRSRQEDRLAIETRPSQSTLSVSGCGEDASEDAQMPSRATHAASPVEPGGVNTVAPRRDTEPRASVSTSIASPEAKRESWYGPKMVENAGGASSRSVSSPPMLMSP